MTNSRFITAAVGFALFSGCAEHPLPPASAPHHSAVVSLRAAGKRSVSPEERVADYLQAAQQSLPLLNSGEGRKVYNQATAELTVLLRSARNGALWNRPLTLTANGTPYRLRFARGGEKGLWTPNEFTSFVPASDVPEKIIHHRNAQSGVGGALVGVRKETPRESFAPRVGVTAAVTATLDFEGRDATLTLRDPGEKPTARLNGSVRPLEADFSAPLAYYPAINETIVGLMGALRVSHYMDKTGLYFLQPYDRDRIPLIFVHGLISTPQMWRNVINEIESDPELRGRYQAWVFAYPTGNPVAYSALRFREELEKARQIYGWPHGFVLVAHSLGGIVSRMQATTLTRADWDRKIGGPAEKLFMGLPKESLIHRSLIFDANPDIARIVFICTPHRGSDMAIDGIGELAMRLIALPGSLTSALSTSVKGSLALFAGGSKRLPNSISSLSPSNPTLKVMDKLPIPAPHHSIIGNRGKPGPLAQSSDGIVPYWSSHLDSAQSEKIVPGPHSSCELPQTIEELKRILKLHLKTTKS